MNNDDFDGLTEQILAELASCIRQVSIEGTKQAAALIEKSSVVFIAGAGRSGLCMRALAMRLMQLGKIVFVVGEVTTPNIKSNDLLIIGSGTGSTASLLTITRQARQQGAAILLFTADSKSPLANLSDQCVVIPAMISRDGYVGNHINSAQPLGTLFEQALFVLIDRIILDMMQSMDVGEKQMAERHANLQ